jgi:hypothetical protein
MFIDGDTKKNGGVSRGACEHLTFLSQQAGIRPLPCSIKHLDLKGCHGAPSCHKCKVQTNHVTGGGTETVPPAGAIDKVRSACDANTLAKIKP